MRITLIFSPISPYLQLSCNILSLQLSTLPSTTDPLLTHIMLPKMLAFFLLALIATLALAVSAPEGTDIALYPGTSTLDSHLPSHTIATLNAGMSLIAMANRRSFN